MEVHQLRYFVAVADLRNFTRAAEKCMVAQPSLSQQIIKLEKELGQPLFDRLGRQVCLTEAGHLLYSQAVRILSSVDEIQDLLLAARDPNRGTVKVGAIPTIAPYLLPPLLKRFRKRYARTTITLNENLTELTLQGCLEGDLDVGIIASPVKNELLHSEDLLTEELLLAFPPGHSLAKKRQVSWTDVADEPFVLMDELHCLGEQVIGYCKQQGCLPIVQCQSVQLLTIQELVALGHGISLIPAMACEMDRGRRCAYRSLKNPMPTRTIRMVWHRDRYQSSLVQQFIQALQETGLS